MQTEANVVHEQFLTFVIDDEEYAVAILRVKEIIGYDTVTRVPRTAAYIRGMINLRGSVVPVVDLAMTFGLRPAPISRSTCIVIVEVLVQDEPVVLGILVDEVRQVIDLTPAQIEPPPQFGTLRTEFLRGMTHAQSERKFILLLDLDRVINAGELAAIETLVAPEPAAEVAEPAEMAAV